MPLRPRKIQYSFVQFVGRICPSWTSLAPSTKTPLIFPLALSSLSYAYALSPQTHRKPLVDILPSPSIPGAVLLAWKLLNICPRWELISRWHICTLNRAQQSDASSHKTASQCTRFICSEARFCAHSETLFGFELAGFRKGHIPAYCSRSVSLEDLLQELELKFC